MGVISVYISLAMKLGLGIPFAGVNNADGANSVNY